MATSAQTTNSHAMARERARTSTDSGFTKSVWMATAELLERPPLERDLETDVCIVGAGIAGLSTAYCLAQSGRRVVVVDDGPIGGGETCRTTAHLTNALDDRYCELEKLHGERGARLAAQSHTAAIDAIERIVAETGARCDFERVDGYLFAPPGESRTCSKQELEAARRAGLAVEWLPQAPIDGLRHRARAALPATRPSSIRCATSRRSRAPIEQAGGRLVRAHAEEFAGGARRPREDGGRARDLGASDRRRDEHARQRPRDDPHQAGALSHLRGGAARAARRGGARAVLGHRRPLPLRAASSRSTASFELLIVGGEDHRTGQSDDGEQRFARLEQWARSASRPRGTSSSAGRAR